VWSGSPSEVAEIELVYIIGNGTKGGESSLRWQDERKYLMMCSENWSSGLELTVTQRFSETPHIVIIFDTRVAVLYPFKKTKQGAEERKSASKNAQCPISCLTIASLLPTQTVSKRGLFIRKK
jgi:hypothetical protein